MRKERMTVRIADIELNEGQLPWLPRNPRQWGKDDVRRTAQSIAEDPDFLEDHPLLLVPMDGGRYVDFAGNLRLEGCRKNKRKDAPCVVYWPETDEDRATIRRRAMKDNGSFGSWDFDALANNWDDLPLTEWGIPAWDTSKMELSTKGREGADGYDAFVDKFNEEIPLTTDDCYTPAEVYDCIRDFVSDNITPLAGRKIVRPFFPGGDYEDLTQYPKGCVVLDNPPFSIYSKIVRFYLDHGIDFFLFGPQLSLIVSDADCCFCPFNVVITYENGAKVNTGFVTNLRKDARIWIDNVLREKVAAIQKSEPTTPVYDYPDEVVSSATLGKIANGGQLTIAPDECRYIHNLDGMKDIGKGLFGGGFLLSQAAAEKARAAAEKARAVKIALSEREKSIVAELSGNAEKVAEIDRKRIKN